MFIIPCSPVHPSVRCSPPAACKPILLRLLFAFHIYILIMLMSNSGWSSYYDGFQEVI